MRKSVYIKHLANCIIPCAVTAAFLLFLNAQSTWGQTSIKKSGKYNITLSVPNENGESQNGRKAYLIKEEWGNPKGIIVDSAVFKKEKVSFKGEVYPFEQALQLGNKQLFTAGEYKIKVGSAILFKFLYSLLDGGNFTENFEKIPNENAYIQEYRRITPRKDKYGPENDLYLKVQNYQKLFALLRTRDLKAGKAAEEHFNTIADSLRHLGANLKLRADRECEHSLFEILISHTSLPPYNPVIDYNYCQMSDDRLLFSHFGEEIFTSCVKMLSMQTREKATKDIFNLLDNKYLTLPLLKSKMVVDAFNIFKDSDVMGTEGTAIDIANKYILSKEVSVNEDTFFQINYFTTLNQNSLLGMKAPQLNLKDPSGKTHTLEECLGYYTIIYFYTDDCAKCALETPKLVDFLDNYTYGPLALVTVYIGSQEDKWKEYLENFNTVNPFVEKINVADLQKEDNTLLDYGIVSTPTLYLLDKNGRIAGRKVKTGTIKEILRNEELSRRKLVSYFENIFTGESQSEVERIIDTLANASSGAFYTDLLGEMYQFLSKSDNYTNQLGAEYLGRKYICEKREDWENKRFADEVCRAVKQFNLNKLGEKATDLKLYDISGLPQNLLTAAHKKQILFFYRPDCGICTESLAELKKLYKKYSKKVIFSTIYIGDNESEFKKYVAKNKMDYINLWDKNSEGLLKEKYDLEGTPKIYLLDENGVVIAKDITVYDLALLLEKE